MEQDVQHDNFLPTNEEPDANQGKKPRSRSRAKRAEKRLESKGPDVDKLLKTLDDQQPGQQLPPLPTMPATPFPPPPPPPPPPTSRASSGRSESTEDEDIGLRHQKLPGKTPKKTAKKGDIRPSGGSQRTSGSSFQSRRDGAKASDYHSSSDNNNNNNNNNNGYGGDDSSGSIGGSGAGMSNSSDGIRSHNRQWMAGNEGTGPSDRSTPSAQPGLNDGRGQPGKSETASAGTPFSMGGSAGSRGGLVYAYGAKPKGREEMCTDITSFRFTPDDDLKVNIALRKMRGDAIEKASPNNEKHVLHQLPAVFSNDVTGVPLAEAPGATSIEDTRDRFLSVADFASQEADIPTVFHTIAKRDAIVFVIVSRPVGARGKLSWDFPPLSKCRDFSNDFISQIYEASNNWARAYVRSGKWGKLGTILLSSADMDEMAEFRRQFALLSYRNESFDMFPKDALTAKADVSILLRASMKTFKTEIIPTVLFARNRDKIAGSLRVMSTTFYSAEELSHKGEPKQFWRSIDLKGDDQFMRCLRFVPENHSFLLGYDSVQIRGGLRPQESNFAIAGTKRPWADIPPPSVPLLRDPRHIFPSSERDPQPDENSARGSAKRGRGGRGSRRGERGSRGRRGRH